jgi:hypothetical protein
MFFDMLQRGAADGAWSPFTLFTTAPAPEPVKIDRPKVGHPQRDRKKIAAQRKAGRSRRR